MVYHLHVLQTIGSVAKSDDYSRVLADPLYTMIRQALYSTDDFHGQERGHCEEKEGHYRTETSHCKRDVTEIVEEECEDDEDENKSVSSSSSSSEEEDGSYIGKTYNGRTLFCISPEVKQALGTLEKVITMVRKSRTDNNNKTSSTSLEKEEEEEASSSQKLHLERAEIVSSSKVCTQDPITEVLDEASLAHYHHNNNNNR